MISSLKSPETSSFLTLNQQVFAELVTFVDFAEGLTIAFLEVNFSTDRDLLINALKQSPDCEGIWFEVFNLSRQPDLRFLRDELMQRLSKIKPMETQKLVVIVRGLEAAIGTDGVGEYPPVLQDLNFVRDAYSTSVPHPILFVLPDYAITRIAKYAPDFWAWRSGVFTFKTLESDREELLTHVLEQPSRITSSEQTQERIEQLNLLLMEYRPSGKAVLPEHLVICSELDYKLGVAYLTQRQTVKARAYLEAALKFAKNRADLALQQNVYLRLGDAYRQEHKLEAAITTYTSALNLAKQTDTQNQVSAALFALGNVALEECQFQQAKEYYQQCLEIDEQQGERYSQVSTYHELEKVVQNLRDYEEIRRYYQQALDIYVEYGDHFAQASTYHNLGMVAQDLEEYQEARRYYQQALDIKIEYGDRFSQARTYYHLGQVAEALGEIEEAKTYYLQDLEITVEFNDTSSLEACLDNLGRCYRVTQSQTLLEAASPILGPIAAELLRINPKYTDQQQRTTVDISKETGQKWRVAVIACEEKVAEAINAGADVVGSEELIDEIQKGRIDFDLLISTPDMMPQVAKVGWILGPRGLMPSPKAGTVTFDLVQAITKFKVGKLEPEKINSFRIYDVSAEQHPSMEIDLNDRAEGTTYRSFEFGITAELEQSMQAHNDMTERP
jgi:ribosomal protein L1